MKTIVWDVDDTLNNLTEVWFNEWWLPENRSATIRFGQLKENPPSHLLGISHEAYLASLDAFRASELAGKIKPAPQVMDWFGLHGEEARHLVLTATPLQDAPRSAAWVLEYFGTWIRSYNVIPSKRPGQSLPLYDKTKIEFLNWLGKASILVEDDEANLKSAYEAGYQVIGIPQPWNNIRCSLDEALAQLTADVKG